MAKLRSVDLEQLKEAFRIEQSGEATPSSEAQDETSFRYAEYGALHHERRDRDDLLSCRPQPLSDYDRLVSDYFQDITLVERLAETRALTGFSRIDPSGGQTVALSRGRVGWLPAFRVHGEGIFLGLRTERLRQFESDDARLRRLLERVRGSGRCPLLPSRELVLLHTLAHLFIKRMSYEAGYGSSSIRERIYSGQPEDGETMAGILLYTAAGDADGTLGGLVGLGKPGVLERIVKGALEDARWCSADPVCMESDGQGPESLNLAACHACTLLPETSCELQNRVLDRTTVMAFFAEEYEK